MGFKDFENSNFFSKKMCFVLFIFLKHSGNKLYATYELAKFRFLKILKKFLLDYFEVA